MTEEERYLFDLQGYLILHDAVAPEALAEMNAWIDAQAEHDTRWQGQTRNAHLDNPLTWAQPFLDLVDNPRVLPYLKEVCGEKIRLDHDYGIFLQPGHTGLKLHGPNATPFDPCHYYHCFNGQIFCGLTVATYALTDVPPGAGGLAIIPGSHKSNFVCPEDIRLFRRESPIVQQVPVRAGDCVLFTEALVHGTLPWKGPCVRRTLFYKYAPCNLAWANHTYFPPQRIASGLVSELQLTEAQRILLQPPSAIDFHQVAE